jgi:hypothetical protein
MLVLGLIFVSLLHDSVAFILLKNFDCII